jgi:hypothetical protein
LNDEDEPCRGMAGERALAALRGWAIIARSAALLCSRRHPLVLGYPLRFPAISGEFLCSATSAKLGGGPAGFLIQQFDNRPGPDPGAPGRYSTPAIQSFQETRQQLAEVEALIDLSATSIAAQAAERNDGVYETGLTRPDLRRAIDLWPV